MNKLFTYCFLIFLFAAANESIAQECQKNMLVIPNASSYAVIPNPKAVSLPGAFTIELWAKSSSFVPSSGLVEQVNKGDTGAFSIRFTSGSYLAVSLKLNTGIVNLTTSSIANIQDWQHYALTFTPNDSIRIYINGILKASQKTSAAKLFQSTDSILIAHSVLSGATFTGNIDELRIWSIARSRAEILASIATTLLGTEAGLRAYYSFDDDPAMPNIHDFTGNKNEGILISSAILDTSTSPVTGTSGGYMLASKELSIKFPDLSCATEADTIIHVFNRGSEPVTIDPVGFQQGIIFSPTTSGFPLPPDSSHLGTIRIHASPVNPGLYRDTLIIPSTTICGGILRIPVELRYHKDSITFVDQIFDLHNNLLPCNLPLPSQTFLRNVGTRPVTITSLQFSIAAGIVIDSPKTPFTIGVGKSQEIKFTVLPVPLGVINTTLTATTNTCSRSAKITFQGKRIIPQFSIPDRIIFPDVHLPASAITLDTIIELKNTGTSTLSMSPPLALQGGPRFKLLTPPSGLALVKPDSTLLIKIRFTAPTIECGSFETALHFQDVNNCGIDTLIPISINVLGPDVSAANAKVDLGARCGAHDTTIILVNRSGRTVTIGKANFTRDSIVSVITTALPRSLSDGDSLPVKIHFAPAEPGRYAVNIRFSLSPCGDAILHVMGTLGVGQIALSDSTLDFGNGCDLSPAIQKLSLTNQCGRQITVTDSKLDGSQNFSVIDPPFPFQMANNETKEITVQFSPKQLGILEQGHINLFDSGCFVTRFSARGVRERAKIEWSPVFAEFGTVCPGQSAVAEITLHNSGYGDDTVSSFHFIGDNVFNTPDIKGTVIEHSAAKRFSVTFSPKDTGGFLSVLQIILAPCQDTTWVTLHGIGGPPATLVLSDSILDFHTIRLGTSDSLCVVLRNPSCIPLSVSIDSIHGNTNSPFALSQSTTDVLPDSVATGDPVTVCFVFTPTKVGSFETTDTIRIGNQQKIITLRGSAGIDSLELGPKSIDFGDVVKDSTKRWLLSIKNKGTYPPTLIVHQQPDPDFGKVTPNKTIGIPLDTIHLYFIPVKLGVQTSKVIFRWGNHFDTITLRGRGIQPGLQFESSLIDFSKVRVAHDSTIAIGVTNTLNTEIKITSVSVDNGKYSISQTGQRIIFPHETLLYSVKYSPNAEMVDSATLTLNAENSGQPFVLPIRGEGVEAHLSINTSAIDFGNVILQQTKYYDTLRVSNTGGYPLVIESIHHDVANFDTATKGVFFIPPDSSVDYVVSFTPQRAITYFDTLRIVADAPEKSASVLLTGRGVFGPLRIPEITYSIPDEQAKVGDILEIPVSIGGKDLSLLDLDTFTVELSYDPTVIYFYDTVITERTLSAGFTTKFERLAHDSIIRISGFGKSIVAVPDRLFILRAEALLGPHDSTKIEVHASDPQNTPDPLSPATGSFVVTDCGNYRGGIVFKGNYSVSAIKPNPVSSTAHIEYELGLPGPVHLDLYNVLGMHIRTIVSGDQSKGKHAASFSTEGIQSGEYIYVLKSLEYEHKGSVIISK